MKLEEVLAGIDNHIWSSELDVAYFLQALIKMMKAECVIECGTFKGLISSHIINAMKDGSGFIGIDIEDHRCESVKRYMSENNSKFMLESSITALRKLPKRSADIIFIDSLHEISYLRSEFKAAESVIRQDGIICLHDTYIPDIMEWINYIRTMNWFEVICLETSEGRGIGVIKCLMS